MTQIQWFAWATPVAPTTGTVTITVSIRPGTDIYATGEHKVRSRGRTMFHF